MATVSVVAVAGCTTASLEDAAPVASATGNPQRSHAVNAVPATAMTAPPRSAAMAAAESAVSPVGLVNTGTYPNLNIKPEVAAKQITPTERATQISAMQSATKLQSTLGADKKRQITTKPEELIGIAKTQAAEVAAILGTDGQASDAASIKSAQRFQISIGADEKRQIQTKLEDLEGLAETHGGKVLDQISPEQRAAALEAIRKAQKANDATPGEDAASTSEVERLKKLAQTHAADILKQIEGN